MPSAAYSFASVRARPVRAARIAFESNRPCTGRRHLFFCMRGKVSLAKKMVLIKAGQGRSASLPACALKRIRRRAGGIGNADIDAAQADLDGSDKGSNCR